MPDVPLAAKIACIILSALFIVAFSVAREPRAWRRMVQAKFLKITELSVNRNKVIDESLKKYGMIVAMAILVADVSLFVWGVTYPSRMKDAAQTAEERDKLSEIRKTLGNAGAEGARRSVSQ